MGDAMTHINLNAYKVDAGILETSLQAMHDGRPLLLVGPPGCGKVVLARMLAKLRGGPLRAPHYTVSQHGMFGNTTPHKEYQGEVDLARGGVLLLDQFSQFRRGVVERLGEEYRVESFKEDPGYLPIFTAESCPCGWLGHHSRTCMCKGSDMLRNYTKRVNEYMDQFPTAFRVVLGSMDPSEGRILSSPFAA
jgi:magnesium chelatase family protein